MSSVSPMGKVQMLGCLRQQPDMFTCFNLELATKHTDSQKALKAYRVIYLIYYTACNTLKKLFLIFSEI